MRILVLALLLISMVSRAQTPGSCEPGTAQGDLDVNEVFARVFNGGNLFHGNGTFFGYHVPQGGGIQPLQVVNLWIGGMRQGQLRVSGTRYAFRFELWPGPLSEDGAPPEDCSLFDRIYVVSQDDVERFLLMGEATDDMLDWPVDLGAPVLDGDGIAGNYELAAGDQPAIYGDQMAWWIMNDVGNVHEETGSQPLGIEVRVRAFVSSEGVQAINRASYYRYSIHNPLDTAIDSVFVGQFVQIELGNAADDYFAADTTLDMGIGYNGDGFDPFYGIPPAFGLKVIQGPIGLSNGRDDDSDGEVDEEGERLGMTSVLMHPNAAGPTFDPRTAGEYYNVLQGIWKDGTPVTEGGDGYMEPGMETTFVFPGDPVGEEFWSEENVDGDGSINAPGQRRFSLGIGPFRIDPGGTQEVVVAIPFAQGTSRLDSVAELRAAAQIVQNAWDTGFLEHTRVEVEPLPPEVPGAIEIQRPFPNPFTDRATLRFTVPDVLPVRITLLDVLGRELSTLASGEHAAGTYEAVVEGSSLAPGVYLVRVEVVGESRAFSIVRPR